MGRKKLGNQSLSIRISSSFVERMAKMGKTPSAVIEYALIAFFNKAGVKESLDPFESEFIDLSSEYSRQDKIVQDAIAELRAIEYRLQTVSINVFLRLEKGEKIECPTIRDYLGKNSHLVEGLVKK